MGILAIFLAAASDTKLSTFTLICSAYSWLNVGGKLLKIAGLKRQLAEESDIKRKLAKLLGNAHTETETDPATLEETRPGGLNRLKRSRVGTWVGNRKGAVLRTADLELNVIRAAIIQERQRRSGAPTDFGASVGLGTSPSARGHRGAEVLQEL